MFSSPKLVALLRLIFIICLTISNAGALWKACRGLRKFKSRHFSRLVLICILLVNLFYVSLVWTPFTLSAFTHYVRLHNSNINRNKTLMERERPIAAITYPHTHMAEENMLRNASVSHDSPDHNMKVNAHLSDGIPNLREARSVFGPVVPEGKWSLAFPVKKSAQQNKVESPRKRKLMGLRKFPEYIGIDCTFQDIVSCAAIYSLAFICVINMILTKKPIFLPMTTFSMPGCIFLLTGIPILATFVIRYSEQIGTAFAPHDPDKISCGYTVYNVICDVHIDDNYVFLSFLEWAGLTMVLLVTVTALLGMSTKAKTNQFQYESISDDSNISLSFVEKASRAMGPLIRDITLYLATLWAWPLKPTVLIVLYVLYGRHWTNSISWISHFILSISTVLLPTSTLLSSNMYYLEETGEEINCKKENKSWKGNNTRRQELCPDTSMPTSTPPDVEDGLHIPSDLQEQLKVDQIQDKKDFDHIHDNSSAFKPCASDPKKPFKFYTFENENEVDQGEDLPSIHAEDVRRKIMQFSKEEKSSILTNGASLPGKHDDWDTKLVLQTERTYSPNTSDV